MGEEIEVLKNCLNTLLTPSGKSTYTHLLVILKHFIWSRQINIWQDFNF